MFLGCLPCCGGPWGCPPTSGIVQVDCEWYASISGIVTDAVARNTYELTASSTTGLYSSFLPGMSGDNSKLEVLLAQEFLAVALITNQTPDEYGQPRELALRLQYSPCEYDSFDASIYTISQQFSLEFPSQGYYQEVTSKSASHGGNAWQPWREDSSGRGGNHYRLRISDADDGSFSGTSTLVPVSSSWQTTRQIKFVDYFCSAAGTVYDVLVDGRSVFTPAYFIETLP